MSSMIDFTVWFVSQVPVFLMAEPVSYLTALFILGFICDLVSRMMRLGH